MNYDHFGRFLHLYLPGASPEFQVRYLKNLLAQNKNTLLKELMTAVDSKFSDIESRMTAKHEKFITEIQVKGVAHTPVPNLAISRSIDELKKALHALNSIFNDEGNDHSKTLLNDFINALKQILDNLKDAPAFNTDTINFANKKLIGVLPGHSPFSVVTLKQHSDLHDMLSTNIKGVEKRTNDLITQLASAALKLGPTEPKHYYANNRKIRDVGQCTGPHDATPVWYVKRHVESELESFFNNRVKPLLDKRD
jgi:hypothetical protein